jgi:hypothetical protein
MSGDRLDPWVDPDFEQSVRDTAYFMWENDGRPDGREQEYWFRALEVCLRQRNLDKQLQEPATHFPDPIDPIAERAAEVSRKVGLQRPFRKDEDDTVSGGFNQKRR